MQAFYLRFCKFPYTGRLYPLFCRFELVLRRLLLAATRVNPSAKGASAFRDQLDKLTLGSVFTFLFSSQDFNKQVRTILLNDRNRQFEKADLIRQIESVSEETVWIELFGMDAMPTMAREHDLIRSCRNDVMHMRPTNRESFLKARRLVIRATTEIEAYTETLTGDQKALGDYSKRCCPRWRRSLLFQSSLMRPFV